jgi:hypothetical protein
MNNSESIFIRDNTPLPENVSIESDAFLPGWRVVRNLDRSTLARNIERAKWYFFYLAGAMKATVFGRNRPGTVRRAVKSILARREEQQSNSLEITEVVARRFCGIPFLSVTAHSRHIQQRVGLVPARNFVLSVAAAASSGEDATKQQGL